MELSYKLVELSVDEIKPHPENDYSMEADELRQLAESIERDGLGQPPLVRRLEDGSFQMIAGHRRLAAYKLLRDEHPGSYATIPVNLVEGITDDQARVLLHVTNLVGREISKEERARRLMAIGELVPALRRQDDRWRGVKTYDVIATIVSEQTGEKISGQTVYRSIKEERRRQEAAEQAAELGRSAQSCWQAEAEAGHVGPRQMRAISALDEREQARVYLEWQRKGGSARTLSRVLHDLGKAAPTPAQMAKLGERAISALSALADAARAGGRPSKRTMPRLEELMSELRREVSPAAPDAADEAIGELLSSPRDGDGPDGGLLV